MTKSEWEKKKPEVRALLITLIDVSFRYVQGRRCVEGYEPPIAPNSHNHLVSSEMFVDVFTDLLSMFVTEDPPPPPDPTDIKVPEVEGYIEPQEHVPDNY